jgi:hypothetical protein
MPIYHTLGKIPRSGTSLSAGPMAGFTPSS